MAVVTALVANIAVAIAKLLAFAITGSSALLAESLHSLADSVNEVLLLVGARRSLRPADLRHPFGHGRYRYVYAFLVSLTVFWIGGVLAVLEGVSHLASREALVDPRWAFAVLAIGAALDGWSLRTTIRAGRSAKGVLSWRELVRVTKAPELIVVFLEDLGALIGIVIAVTGVGLATITGDGAWDALASIAIGLLLMAIGLLVNRETQSLLLGESASDEVIAAVRRAIGSTHGIKGVVDLRTIHVGPDDLVVAAGIIVDPGVDATEIAGSVVLAEARIRAAVPFRTVIYLESRLEKPPSGGDT
ncbi:MAG TPA: cation diffusion facilitator family transporter [Candidatus Limnocylindrales bacterium]|nr:cation diffusion facilitator family transporter [Candidatus Limnocylindrales bacterium]